MDPPLVKTNIKLIVSYQGTHYFGWQKTKEGPSIEESLERALFQVLQKKISLQAASRTDVGVHAEGQVVNFFTEQRLDHEKLKKKLNELLPTDISILEVEEVTPKFHPTLSSTKKEYHYYVCNSAIQLPFHRAFSWHFPYFLDKALMKKACLNFIGIHDFSAFCNARHLLKTNAIREIFHCEIQEVSPDRLLFIIKGTHFLYKMVRNMVGTLIYIGAGKILLSSLPSILASQDRTQSGMTAPAHGLRLKKIFYN